jgi:hypothetical protein
MEFGGNGSAMVSRHVLMSVAWKSRQSPEISRYGSIPEKGLGMLPLLDGLVRRILTRTAVMGQAGRDRAGHGIGFAQGNSVHARHAWPSAREGAGRVAGTVPVHD